MPSEPFDSRLIWFELHVRDLRASESQYGDLFGWTFEPFEEYDAENYHLASTASGQSAKGALVRSADGYVGFVPYFEVSSLRESIDEMQRQGGALVNDVRRIGPSDGFFALVADAQGIRLGLWSNEDA